MRRSCSVGTSEPEAVAKKGDVAFSADLGELDLLLFHDLQRRLLGSRAASRSLRVSAKKLRTWAISLAWRPTVARALFSAAWAASR